MTADSAPSFFFEFLPNIRQLTVCSKLESTGSTDNVLYFDSERKLLTTNPLESPNALPLATLHHSPTWTELSLSFLTDLQPPKPSVLSRQNSLFIQFRGVSLAEEAKFTQLRAADLQACTRISCSACDQAFPSDPVGLVWKDLPNEHWLELLDCWSCHDNEFAPIAERALSQNRDEPSSFEPHSSYHGLNNSTSALILPPKGRMYVGLSHIIAHIEDWPVLTCSRCESAVAEPTPSSQRHCQVRKDACKITAANGQTLQESTEGLLMCRIRDAIDNSSVYRFLLTASGSNAEQLFLIVMNWNVRVKVQTGLWRPAIKLGLRSRPHCDLGTEEYETVHLTPAQLRQISTTLLKTHADLMMGEEATLPQCLNAGPLKIALLYEQATPVRAADMAKGKRDPDTRGSDASTLANPTLPVTALNNVRVYNISGNTHRSLPDWLVRRSARALKKDDEWTRRVELIQDLEFPEASIQAKFTRDGKYIIAAGTYKPQFRVFELAEMSMKFDRHTDAETVALEVLSEDWTKLVLLQADRAIELHGPCGLYQAVKTPRVGRAMFFDAFSCDLVVGASDTSVYRLNLDRGQFLASLETDQPSGCGVNAVARAPLHGLYGFGCENGAVEFWDRRDRRRVAALKLFGTDEQLSSPFEVSALTFLPDGITWAAGTSTGQVSLFDLRSSKPILTRDHHYGYPIKEVRHHAASGCLLSYDRKALRLWNRNTGSLLTTVEPSGGADLNHVAFKGDGEDGFLLCSVEDRQMQSFFIPELGPAPRWASFLENLTEEMEEGQKVCGKASLAPGAVYDNYKFVTRSELADLNMDHLIGTNVLRAYMHGFFIDLRLWEKARAIANPFAYEEYLEEQRRTKLEAERASRIKGATNVHPSKKAAPKTKVNSVLAERLAKQSELLAKLDSLEASEATRSTDSAEASTADESLAKVNKKMIQAAKTSKAILSDSRFAALFTNPDFGQDEASPEFKQFHAHPIKSEPDHEN